VRKPKDRQDQVYKSIVVGPTENPLYSMMRETPSRNQNCQLQAKTPEGNSKTVDKERSKTFN